MPEVWREDGLWRTAINEASGEEFCQDVVKML